MASILELMNHVQQQGDIGTQRTKTSRLGQLMAQGYQQGGDRSQLLGQIAQVSPDAAPVAQKTFGAEDDAKMERIGQMASMLVSMPAETRAQAYPQIAQQLHGMGMGQGLPDQWDESMLPTVQGIAQQLGGIGKSADMQKFNAMTQGLSPEEIAKARRIDLGLDPRAVTGAMKFDTFSGADGRPRPQRNNPTTGQVEIFYDEMGQWVPLGGGTQSSAAPAPQESSGMRVQFDNPGAIPPAVQAAIRANPDAWGQVPDGTTANIGDAPIGGSGLGVGRRPEDEAAAKAAAEESAKLGLLDDRGRIEADNARLQKSAELAATRESQRIEDAPKARAALQGAKNAGENVKRAITQALPNINVWTAGYAGVPLSKLGGSQAANLRASLDTIEANIAFDRLQQMRESSPTGGALGSVSERELTLLGSALTSLKQSQSPAQLKSNLEFLGRQYDKVLKQMEVDFNTDFGSTPKQGSGGFRILD